MPRFLDMHTVPPGTRAEDIAEAHAKDLAGRALSSAWIAVTSAGSYLGGNCLQDVLLLVRRQSEERAQAPFGHDRFRQRVAEGGQRGDDLGCEFKQAQDLSHTGAGHPEPAGQISPRRALPHAEFATLMGAMVGRGI